MAILVLPGLMDMCVGLVCAWCVCGAQALFLWWWGWLVGAHVGRAWGLLGALLALNYYWTTQVPREKEGSGFFEKQSMPGRRG